MSTSSGTLVTTFRDSSGKPRRTNGFGGFGTGWHDVCAGDVGIVVHAASTLIDGDDPGDAVLIIWSCAGLLTCPRSAFCVVVP